MIRLGTLMDVRDTSGPVTVMRYNMYSASGHYRQHRAGHQLRARPSRLMQADRRPASCRSRWPTDWTELAYMQLQAGNAAIYVFALAVVFVFLVLAAQYESWSLPLAVILVVPMCLLCSVTGGGLAGTEVNIFTQIGFVVLVGLASKNAILIVEFAKQQRKQGRSRREAALEASRLRLRPILMTSLAFIFGVVPLVFASGAGAEMRQTLGVAVFSGMLGVTLFGIFLTPVFFSVIQSFSDRRRKCGSRLRRLRHGAAEPRTRYRNKPSCHDAPADRPPTTIHGARRSPATAGRRPGGTGSASGIPAAGWYWLSQWPPAAFGPRSASASWRSAACCCWPWPWRLPKPRASPSSISTTPTTSPATRTSRQGSLGRAPSGR